MSYYESAKEFVLTVIAVALQATVAVIERMLPYRTDWVERIDILAAELRAAENRGARSAAKPAEPPTGSRPSRPSRPSRRGRRFRARPAGSSTSPPSDVPAEAAGEAAADDDPAQVIAAYNELWRFVQQVKEQGLSLDDAFCERVQRDWNTGTLLGYVRAIEKSLCDRAAKAQGDAAERLASERGA
jgi:hypothetical protein